jgi:hypothetical protein
MTAHKKPTSSRDPLDPSLQLRQIVRQSIEPCWTRRLGREYRDSDGLLVDIHAEIDHLASKNDFGN